MIIIPKRRDIELPMRVRGPLSQMAGVFTFRLGKAQPDGTLAVQREYEFPNLIVDQGLDRMGDNGNYNAACQIGTGTTPPAPADTGLVNPVGSASMESSGRNAAIVTGPPRYSRARVRYRFGPGVGTGNLTEVGISWTNGVGQTLYNRALILDGSGAPIAITKLEDETLDVTYELRTYVPLEDVTGDVLITGSGTHDYIIRAAEADQTKPQYGAGWGIRTGSGLFQYGSAAMSATNQGNGAFEGDITDINGSPSTSAGAPLTIANLPYIGGSMQRNAIHNYGLGGRPIRSILYSFGWSSYQIQFDPPIPKSAENTFQVEFTHNWARRSL